MGLYLESRRAVSSLAVLALLVLPGEGVRAQAEVSSDTLLVVARDIMQAARYCGLVTFDESGGTRIRTMDPFPPEPDMVIWMGTHRESRKVQDIERNPRVTLYYPSPDAVGYVSITGEASLVDDPAEKGARWKEEWGAFYSDREADYLLIKVIPEKLEVIDFSRGIGGDPETWEPPSVVFRGSGGVPLLRDGL